MYAYFGIEWKSAAHEARKWHPTSVQRQTRVGITYQATSIRRMGYLVRINLPIVK